MQRLGRYYYTKKLQSHTVIRDNLCKARLYKKGNNKMLMKLTPGLNFTNIFTLRFYARRFQKGKKTDDLTVYFCAFEIYERKSCTLNVDEIDPWFQKEHLNKAQRITMFDCLTPLQQTTYMFIECKNIC